MALYQLMLSGIVPRPIAFVSTISNDGVENLAPFSWFNMVTHDPPTLSIACTNGLARIKDTTNNIKSGNGFTVNIISEPFAQQANACSINTPEKMSEWPISGLTKEPSLLVKAARVKESGFSMECEVN
jgi:flavin reductase (DIM6/NTAB) family NADH-FMN oxidoreductase RutF